MLFNEPCKTGQLQVDESTIQVMAPFQKLLWSTPREDVTYIGLKTGPIMADLTIYTAQNTFPASFIAKQKAERFLAFFPGVPVGLPIQQQTPLAVSSPPSWQSASLNAQESLWSGTLPESHPEPASQRPSPSQPLGDSWQTPQQPLPNYSQQTSAPGPFPPYQQYPYGQQKPYEQMPSQRRPPRLSRRTWFIIAAVVIVLLLIDSISNAIQNKSSNTSNVQATPTSAPVQAQATTAPALPTDTPVPAPTPKPQPVALGKQMVIGNTVAAFNAKYGKPVSQSNNSNGSTTYKYGAVAQDVGQIDVVTFPNSQQIYGIILAPSGVSWDAVTAYTTCLAFDPEDSTVGTGQSVQNTAGTDVGLFQDGKSTELANSLPASDFFNQDSSSSVAPGTFSLLFSYVAGSNGTQANFCSTVVGEQSTSSLTQS